MNPYTCKVALTLNVTTIATCFNVKAAYLWPKESLYLLRTWWIWITISSGIQTCLHWHLSVSMFFLWRGHRLYLIRKLIFQFWLLLFNFNSSFSSFSKVFIFRAPATFYHRYEPPYFRNASVNLSKQLFLNTSTHFYLPKKVYLMKTLLERWARSSSFLTFFKFIRAKLDHETFVRLLVIIY